MRQLGVYRIFILLPILLLAVGSCVSRQAKNKKLGLPSEKEIRIEKLLSRMTLEEKIGQMVLSPGISPDSEANIRKGKVGAFFNVMGAKETNRLQRIAVEESRLGIPLLFGLDIIHGYRTVTPIPLAEAASWNLKLLEISSRLGAREGRASGIRWSFAPMADVSRDPRWGRIIEGAGEDPYLVSMATKARVRGYQKEGVAACVKHMAAYGAPEGGRDYNTVDLSPQTLFDTYLPPFEAAVDEGVYSVMSAFNTVNGIPATGNRWLLREILRERWGFEGFVVSDYDSIPEMVDHGFAKDGKQATKLAIEAGVDMDMVGTDPKNPGLRTYRDHLPELLRSGAVSVERIDRAVRRILRVKFLLGLFEDPYTDESKEKDIIPEEGLNSDHRAIARNIAIEAVVLLKNDRFKGKPLLPISKSVKRIAIIGPFADDQRNMRGAWAGDPFPGPARDEDPISFLDGMRALAPAHVKVTAQDGTDLSSAIRLAKSSDLVFLAVGERIEITGEGGSRSILRLPGKQPELVQAISSTGTPSVLVLFSGRPLEIWREEQLVPTVVQAWHLGVEAGSALAKLFFGHESPSGRLPLSYPRNVGQIPIHYNHLNTGRSRVDSGVKWTDEHGRWETGYAFEDGNPMQIEVGEQNDPLYPFGHGLTYASFEYSNLRLGVKKRNVSFGNDKSLTLAKHETLTLEVDVRNRSSAKAKEVVQVYIRDLVGSRARPVAELKAFEKVSIRPRQSQRLQFEIPVASLGFHDENLDYVVERGEFEIWVGKNAEDSKLKRRFLVTSER